MGEAALRVVVTGAAGFIGTHTVRTLVQAGHEVYAVDRAPPRASGGGWPRGATFRRLDVGVPAFAEFLQRVRPHAVVHLAAQARVDRSLTDPEGDFSANLAVTARVARWAVRAGCRRVVFSSSAAVYGPPAALPLSEDAPCRPVSPYGLHKWLAEQYLLGWGFAHGLEVVVLRYANVYGPGQAAGLEGGVVAAFVERLRRGLPLVIHGDGSQTRDFVYVEDVARANLLALTAPAAGTVINVGTGRERSVRELAEALCAVARRPLTVAYGPPRPGDIPRSALDPDRAQRLLGWRPQVEFDDGLRRCLEAPGP